MEVNDDDRSLQYMHRCKQRKVITISTSLTHQRRPSAHGIWHHVLIEWEHTSKLDRVLQYVRDAFPFELRPVVPPVAGVCSGQCSELAVAIARDLREFKRMHDGLRVRCEAIHELITNWVLRRPSRVCSHRCGAIEVCTVLQTLGQGLIDCGIIPVSVIGSIRPNRSLTPPHGLMVETSTFVAARTSQLVSAELRWPTTAAR